MGIIKNYVLEDHSTDGNRAGEGSVVELDDGTLYFVYGKFDGNYDASPAKLVSRRSTDGGESWGETEVFIEPAPSWQNVMSVSLLRLQNRRIGCAFLVKSGEGHEKCIPYWMVSDDDAKSWSDPKPIVKNGHYIVQGKQHIGYYVVNNDRLLQLDSGRLLLPYHYYIQPPTDQYRQPACGCLISDDNGESWRHGWDEIKAEPENYHIPDAVVADPVPLLRLMKYNMVNVQEPGVVELSSGRVLMWARSNGGCAYAAISADGGDNWSPFKPLCKIPMPQGPSAIKRVPGTGRLVMIHPDRSGVPYGSEEFMRRTPLAVSVSDDEGVSWQRHKPLIGDDTHNYCYYSLLFCGDRSVITTYESARIPQKDGSIKERNSARLRVIVLENSWWKE